MYRRIDRMADRFAGIRRNPFDRLPAFAKDDLLLAVALDINRLLDAMAFGVVFQSSVTT